VHNRGVYLRDEEQAALNSYARQTGSSANAVIRLAIRLRVGLPVPSWAIDELDEIRKRHQPT
jgi:hypothetical protein